jgi:sulfite exporter TauE/SafE
LGVIGIMLGAAVFSLEAIESFRGDIAGWFLILFGLFYTVYGVRFTHKNTSHEHLHPHNGDVLHSHTHSHSGEHSHFHENKSMKTPWILFLIFVFGPCEPLIPLLIYPASQHSFFGVAVVSSIFAIVTISTMLTIVVLSLTGIKLIPVKKIEKHIHTFAGLVILLCGISIQFLGL